MSTYFDLSDFQDPTWTNTNDFLLKHRNRFESLNSFADALNSYGEELKSRLTTIIHDDYQKFVSISKQLLQLGDYMAELIKSLTNSENAVDNAVKTLQQSIQPIKAQTEKLHKIRIEEAICKLALEIVISLENIRGKLNTETTPDVFADVAIGFAIARAQLKGIDQPALSIRIQADFDKIFNDFTTKLCNAFVKSIKEKDDISLQQILIATILSNQFNSIYKAFSDAFVLEELKNLKKKNKDACETLQQIKYIINNTDGPINYIHDKSLAIFDFALYSVWPNISDWIVKYVDFPVGTIKELHDAYIKTMEVIAEMEKLCRSKEAIIELRKSPGMVLIFKNMKIDFYTNLVSIKIIQDIPQAENHNPEIIDEDFKLSTTKIVFDQVKRCFSSEYFVPERAGDFVITAMKIVLIYIELSKSFPKSKSFFAYDMKILAGKLEQVIPDSYKQAISMACQSLIENSTKLENEILEVLTNETVNRLDFISTIFVKATAAAPSKPSMLAAEVFSSYTRWVSTEKSPLNSKIFATKIVQAVLEKFKQKAMTSIQDVRSQSIAIATFNKSSSIDPKLSEMRLKQQLLLDLECIATKALGFDVDVHKMETYVEMSTFLRQEEQESPESTEAK